MEAITHVLVRELGARGISVNAVAPGPVDTKLFTTGKPVELTEKIIQMNPFGRLGTADDSAAVAVFLAGSEAGWINGQTIRANGGVI